MTRNTFYLLIAALAGILAFVTALLLIDIPARITTGNHARVAGQLLESMRPPMLTIEKGGSTVPKAAAMTAFTQSSTDLKKQVAQYLETSRYSDTLLEHVTHFSWAVDRWLTSKVPLSEYPQQPDTATGDFLDAMGVLAQGEQPIRHDIDQGRKAGHTLQVLAALLMLYLLSLIVIFQRMARKILLASFNEAEEARHDLAQREEYLSLTLDSIGDAVIATDAQGHVTRMNPIAEQMTGWSGEEACQQPLKKILHLVNASTRKPLPDPVEKVLRDGQIIGLANHTVLIARNGQEYQIANSGAPIRDDKEHILGVILVFRDVTEEYRMQTEIRSHRDELEQRVAERTEALEQSNRELESFSYAVSHDLRAPLRSINGFSEALLEDNSEQLDETGRNYLNRVAAAARHMSELIDAMLVLSRVTRKDIRHTDVNLSKAAQNIAVKLQERDPSRSIEWKIADGLHAEGDTDLLYLVLENLLSNAWKYSSKNTGRTCIEFGSSKQDGQTVFFVRDNGCGFNTDYADKLFTAFQRLHGKEYEGTGIGLATVQRIIQRHHGRVWADSKTNEGTTFYFTIG